MTITGAQKFGLIMGIIPGPNIIASAVKFAYYNSQETELKEVARAQVEKTAKKVDEAAQRIISSIENDIGNLKWYALLQIIPFIGVYFAWAEKELLERINNIINNGFNAAHNNLSNSSDVNSVHEPIKAKETNELDPTGTSTIPLPNETNSQEAPTGLNVTNLPDSSSVKSSETISDKIAKSPFRESFFTIIDDFSTFEGLSDLESKALQSILTLTQLLGLTKPLSELPRFPLQLNTWDNVWNLYSPDSMSKIQHPISFDFGGDGSPFIIIKVLSAEDNEIASPMFLYCGSFNTSCGKWSGWREHYSAGNPAFLEMGQLIDSSGNLMYPEKDIQFFKDLMANKAVEDIEKNKWILAPQTSLSE